MNLEYQKPRVEAIEKIENYIIKNGLKPDDKLPSERAFCEMWDFNRSTLRSAIKQLILEGKIYNKNGSGTYVSREKLVRNLQDVNGLYQTAMAAGRQISTRILSLQQCETNKLIGKKMKLPLGHKVWRLERVRSLDGVPAVLSTLYFDAERFPDIHAEELETTSLYEILKARYHVEPVSGTQKLSISSCEESEAECLHVNVGHPIIYQSGITMDENGKIFEYFKELTRSESICFASELTRR
ncbi:MAG: GntR family transcriptional regulator [Lachnospiraceae bacterium]|nr:GntR family transcriptional regulator [Lachnospiraceae bacterium]